MFFILSKALQYFIFPLTWMIILFLFQVFSRSPRRKKNLFIINIILFWVFSNGWLINIVAHAWDYPPSDIAVGKQYSCAILLGGFVTSDKNERGYFNAASDRFIQAANLYHTGTVSHILITGGNGSLSKSNFKESEWASQQLQRNGVPAQAILIEIASRNTLENGAFTKRVLDSAHLQPPYVLVTSAFHMRRSMLVFGRQGLSVVPYPSNYSAGIEKFSIVFLLPTAHTLDLWNIYIKEMIGYGVYTIKGS